MRLGMGIAATRFQQISKIWGQGGARRPPNTTQGRVEHIKELVIHSDCKMAVDGIAKGRQHTSKTKLGQLWTCVWDEYEACIASGIQIIVLKVKSMKKTPARCHKSCKMVITAQITTRDPGA